MKLEDIKKDNIHQVPEGYFEELPQKIQARIAQPKPSTSMFLLHSLKYAIPALLLAAVSIYYLTNQKPADISPEDMLAEVSTSELINFLEDSEITTEEIIENIDITSTDIRFEQEDTELLNDFNETELEELLDEYDDFEAL